MNLTNESVASAAPNTDALSNARTLMKKSLSSLGASGEGELIFGECAGSGSKPYSCHADFSDPDSPVYSCSCPSRQIPCKHVLALMLAWVADKSAFASAEVPAGILESRRKRETRAVKRASSPKSDPAAPKSAAWTSSARKKISSQIEGLDKAASVLSSIAGQGLAGAGREAVSSWEEAVKGLDSHFIPGIQEELGDLLHMMRGDSGDAGYEAMSRKMCRVHAIIKSSRAYLETKALDPSKPDAEGESEELIGNPWKYEELTALGLAEKDTRLVQLFFHEIREPARSRFVDEGYFISLNSGRVLKTRNYRPFKAAKHIKEDDSVEGVVSAPLAAVYPAKALNPRVRWESAEITPLVPEVCREIVSLAVKGFARTVREVKNQLRDLTLPENPAVLVAFDALERRRDPETRTDHFAIRDSEGERISLSRISFVEHDLMSLLGGIQASTGSPRAMLVMFENDPGSGRLLCQPLALVDGRGIARLA